MSQTFFATVNKSETVLRQLAARYEDVVVKDPDVTSELEHSRCASIRNYFPPTFYPMTIRSWTVQCQLTL